MACCAQFSACTLSLRSLQVSTCNGWPPKPPWALTIRENACAMAGIPGIFVALVFCGAQVMTTMGSRDADVPGMTPQPLSRNVAAAANAPTRRDAVMDTQVRPPLPTGMLHSYNGGGRHGGFKKPPPEALGVRPVRGEGSGARSIVASS